MERKLLDILIPPHTTFPIAESGIEPDTKIAGVGNDNGAEDKRSTNETHFDVFEQIELSNRYLNGSTPQNGR